MKKTKVKEEVLKMKFEEVYDRFQKKKLTTEEASELLRIVQQFFCKFISPSISGVLVLQVQIFSFRSPILMNLHQDSRYKS